MIKDNPFLQYPDLLENRQRVRAILLDFFLDKKANANVLVAAYDSGIALAIKNCNVIDNTFALRFEKILINDFAIQPKMAKWSVLYWVEMYGKRILKKNVSVTDLNSTEDCEFLYDVVEDWNVFSIFQDVEIPYTDDSQDSEIKIDEIGDGERVPQNIIVINTDSFNKYGIRDYSCVIKKVKTTDFESCLSITGDYKGKTSERILLIIMCFNKEDEMIGTSFNQTVNDSVYSTNLYLPKWEVLSKVEVKAALNPALI